MQLLDQWLHFVDTAEVLPLFERNEKEYRIPSVKDTEWNLYDQAVVDVVRDNNFQTLRRLTSIDVLSQILNLLKDVGEKRRLREIYTGLLDLESNNDCSVDRVHLARCLLRFLPEAVYLVTSFFRSQTWNAHKEHLTKDLVFLAPTLLKGLVLVANQMKAIVRDPLLLLLGEVRQISLPTFSEVVELVALTIHEPDVALDLLMECIEPESTRLLVGRLSVTQQLTKSLFGIALDHIDEAASSSKPFKQYLELEPDGFDEGYEVVETSIRIDSPGEPLRAGDHVRLRVASPPQNAPILEPYSMDAIVVTSVLGAARLRCLHRLPVYVKECNWKLTHCGSFVTSKAMFDAVTAFYAGKSTSCKLYGSLVGLLDCQIELPETTLDFRRDEALNDSQNRAIEAAMTHRLAFLWGPPGTGKTQTIAALTKQLLTTLPHARFLVTAPTHNAVDNMLHRFVTEKGPEETSCKPLRVSTSVSKVHSARSLSLSLCRTFSARSRLHHVSILKSTNGCVA